MIEIGFKVLNFGVDRDFVLRESFDIYWEFIL